ncbi:MAG: nucleotidyltransferase domain-containing protein [Chloroflexota bacterium]|nr:nucleotidyltransferase domain-containing protein [Chloroflexota bacterium]
MNKLLTLTDTERQALETMVQRLHTRYNDQVESVTLFGSKARGDSGPDSDIDVIVVLTNDDHRLRSNIRRLAARVSLEYDLLISMRAVGRSHWHELSHYRFPIYQAIQSEGISLTPEPA